jgi:hypothetical protein
MPEFDLTVLAVGAHTARVVPDVNTVNADDIGDVEAPLTPRVAAHHPAP